jgi:hypothetical protein
MVEGRLLGNKRDAKLTSQRSSIETELNMKLDSKPEPETPNLDHTIKRLAERTNMKGVLEQQKSEERIRTVSESSHDANFNLNQRISNLPSLSYDVFHSGRKTARRGRTGYGRIASRRVRWRSWRRTTNSSRSAPRRGKTSRASRI